jgi:Ca2+-transporting ATPase
VWAFLFSLGMQLAVLTIPAAASIFKVATLPLEDWELMAAMALLPLVLMEAVKWFRRSHGPAGGQYSS